jgi:hypothetical protein
MADSELHALIVKIDGDLSGLRAELRKGQEDAGGFSKTIGAIFAGGALLKGAEALTDAVMDFAKTLTIDAVKAAEESEASVTRLNTALKLTGRYSPEATAGLQDLAAELQRTTKFEDDSIISAQGLIQSLGKLTNDGLKNATKAAVDLSAGLGIDLNNAALIVGKAAAGEVGTLGRYGLKIQDTGDKARDFANALKAIESAFGGSAQSQAKTFEGSIAQLGNAFGDTKEEIGKLVTENEVVKDVIHAVTDVVRNMTAGITENKEAWSKLVAEGLVTTIDVLVAVGSAADAVARVFDAAFHGIETVVLGTATAIANRLGMFSKDWAATADTLAQMTKESAQQVGKAFTEDTKLGEATVLLANVGRVAHDSFDSMKDGLKVADGEVWNLRDAVAQLTAEEERAGEAGKKIADKLGGAGSTEQLDAKLELLKAQREAELITNTQYNQQENELLNQKLVQQAALVEAAHAQGKIGEQAYINSITALNTKYRVDKAKADIEMQKAEKLQNQQKLADTQSTLGNISGLMQSNSKELFAIGKAAAIANATINMFEGISKAWALGPILGPILAPLVAVAGAAQIASIASQQPKFAEGGTVPGFGFGDTQMIAATPGEEIIDRSTSGRFRDFMERMDSGEGGPGGVAQVEITLSGDLAKIVEATIVKSQRLKTSVLKRIS